MRLRFLGHSCFELSSGETTVLIDPFLTGNPRAAVGPDDVDPSAILLTHGHPDHVGDTLAIARRTGAPVLAITELAAEIAQEGVTVKDPNLGGTVDFEWGWAKLVPAWHTSTTPKGTVNTPAGLLIEFDGAIVYHLGDTALFEGLRLVGQNSPIDVALVCIGGHYTMDRFDAVTAARLIGARTVIPCHYDTNPLITTDPHAFKADVESTTPSQVHVLAPGESHWTEVTALSRRHELTADVPRFSVAERDHRWQRVRTLMREEELDAIFVPPNTGFGDQFQANVRYLTGIGGNSFQAAAVIPLEGQVTAITSPNVDVRFWQERQDWVRDIRPVTVSWGYAGAAVERLHELGLRTPRIGVTGLSGNMRFPEGVTSLGIFDGLREAFPDAELVNANLLMDRARFVKSQEELSFMRAAITLVEEALEVMRHEARPGVPENVVYARMIASMVEGGGELPTMILWSAGWPQPPSNQHMPSRRVLRTGDLICAEAEARWGGYIAQITQLMFVGRATEEYRHMFSIQQEALAACYENLRPGRTVGDLCAVADGFSTDAYECRLIMHARGLGDDAPMAIYGNTRDELLRDWPIEENSVFVVKPVVMTPDHSKRVYCGDTVAASWNGAIRLGQRPLELIETDG